MLNNAVLRLLEQVGVASRQEIDCFFEGRNGREERGRRTERAGSWLTMYLEPGRGSSARNSRAEDQMR